VSQTHAPKPATAGRPASARPKRASERFLENVESLAVAVILALIIRHFVIQPFQIPTGSMKPTLIGEESFGDRILVDMFTYKFSEPKRYDVVVFRYPLNRGVNFVKRLIGLPGEQLDIRNGDDWVNGAIVRKPRDVQNGMWSHWPLYEFESNYRAAFQERGDGKWTAGDAWRLSATGEALLEWKGKAGVRDGFGNWAGFVGDRLLRFEFRFEADRGEVIAEIREGADTLRLHVGSPSSGGGLTVTRGDETLVRRPDVKLDAGRWHTIAFGNPDEQIQIDVDGASAVYEPYRSLGGGTGEQQSLSLGGSATEASFRAVAIARDLFHSSPPDGALSMKIPADSFVMLGDNTAESKDSRLWKTLEIRTPDGGTATIDDGEIQSKFDMLPPGGPRDVVDQWGDVYSFASRPEVIGGRESAPFVHRDLLLGRAFFVFFPFVRTSPFRINWRGVH
jgi:signal peptidase I